MHPHALERARDAFRTLFVAISILAAASLPPVHAATITVTGTGDTSAVDGVVTLREAVLSINAGANVNADVVAVGAYGVNDTINFAIPGAGVHTIAPASAYSLSQPVTINGYSQPGASPNTNGPTQGTNAVLLIELNLTAAGGGITVNGGGSTIRGLVVNRSTSNAITLASNNNTVAGNFIGTNPTGAAAGPGNTGDGVFVTGSVNTIGGTTPADRNLISANGWGVRITSAGGNFVFGNLIGTTAAGTLALGNFGQGIGASGASNTIGGGTAAERNVVAGNGQHGILMNGSLALIAGNYVGTDVAGGAALGNGQDGIHIAGPNNFVGGLGGFGNLVSGNGGHGIMIANQAPGGASVIGNLVGTTASGTLPIGGQAQGGIEVSNFSNGNTISNNVVAFNLGPGVFVAGQGATGGVGNVISQNSIHSNGLLGIKLGAPPSGPPTPNDPGDGDTGPNGLQNYPVITSGSIAAGVLTVGGTFNSLPNSQFTVEVFVSQACDNSLFGEGQTYLGNFSVGTNAAGDASFGPLNFPGVPAGQAVVTMTATNATGGTSEFSACLLAGGPPPVITINDVSQLEGNAGTTPFVFTVTISSSANATVNFATADGTASASSDYAANSGTVTFTAGGPVTQTVTVLVNGDLLVEPNETFFVNLSGATGATIGDAQGVGTIINDDAPPVPVITINDVSQLEGNAGTTPFVFTVTISSSANATVNFVTADGTANAGSDYAANSGTVTFTAGGPVTQTVTVLVNGDLLVEPNETFFVNLSGATGATIGDVQGVGTIVNDDGPPPPSTPIPTLGEWQLILLVVLLAAAGGLAHRKRRS